VKTIDTSLLATYRSGGPTIAAYVVIGRTDGQTFRWISLDRDLEIGGHTFESAPGVDVTSIVSTEGFAVDNAEVKVLDTGDEITRAGILAGIWDGASFEIGEVDWKAATPVKNILKLGKLGNFTPKRGYFVAEFRDLRQAIQNPRETVMQPTCRYTLGDAKCTKDVSGSPFTVTGTIDSSTSPYTVVDAARSEADDYFGEGRFTFTSGANAGLSQKIKSYNGTTKAFVFWQQFIYPIEAGDAYTAVVGCRLRFQEDCITKLDNGINFGGEPNKKNPDVLSAPVW
jgi:uncharacterized phage protein (TIGR02218 family)